MTYSGIDLHSNNMVIVAINSNGEVIQETKLPTSQRALEDFFRHL
jgi:predicted NBD/HSP70 family sugar kinase